MTILNLLLNIEQVFSIFQFWPRHFNKFSNYNFWISTMLLLPMTLFTAAFHSQCLFISIAFTQLIMLISMKLMQQFYFLPDKLTKWLSRLLGELTRGWSAELSKGFNVFSCRRNSINPESLAHSPHWLKQQQAVGRHASLSLSIQTNSQLNKRVEETIGMSQIW